MPGTSRTPRRDDARRSTWGVGIYFNGNAAGTDCIDGTAYTGVQFDISGTTSAPAARTQYSTNDSAHSNNATDPKGSGDSTVYAPQATLTVAARRRR